MKVDIWSDIVCPFCYLGKRLFENALEEFEHKDEIEIVWHSFELSPDLKTDPSKNTYEYLAEKKGWTLEQSKQMHGQIIERAKEAGLEYNFDTAIPANSFDAHRLLHLAKQKGVQNELEEQLFKAHFTDGKNIDDKNDLLEIGLNSGLSKEEISDVLESDKFADDVRTDISIAQQIGIQGVPFFVLNNKYAVSGAQPKEAFVQALNKAWEYNGES